MTRPKLAALAFVCLHTFGCQIPICNFVSKSMYVCMYNTDHSFGLQLLTSSVIRRKFLRTNPGSV